ncbi:MAG TPA: AMP-binding protein, partial [Pseudonocardiaceae bacterium]|nr:AMP-binding protein [Pseudonocardiaceae bacterium]
MVRLAELSGQGQDWAEARLAFRWPHIDSYNIAADCLTADPSTPAILVADDDGVTTVTFGELDTFSATVAGHLVSLGCVPGDRVAIKLSQSMEMAKCVLGALRAGLVVVPLSTVLGDDGLRHRLADSTPRVLIAAGSQHDIELADTVDAALLAPGDLRTDAAPGFVATAPDSPALLMYTSGTTGKPKGVLHGHRVLLGHHSINYALDRIRPGD